MKTVLTRQGIETGRINYQDNGNWRHELHVQIIVKSLIGSKGSLPKDWLHDALGA